MNNFWFELTRGLSVMNIALTIGGTLIFFVLGFHCLVDLTFSAMSLERQKMKAKASLVFLSLASTTIGVGVLGWRFEVPVLAIVACLAFVGWFVYAFAKAIKLSR